MQTSLKRGVVTYKAACSSDIGKSGLNRQGVVKYGILTDVDHHVLKMKLIVNLNICSLSRLLTQQPKSQAAAQL